MEFLQINKPIEFPRLYFLPFGNLCNCMRNLDQWRSNSNIEVNLSSSNSTYTIYNYSTHCSLEYPTDVDMVYRLMWSFIVISFYLCCAWLICIHSYRTFVNNQRGVPASVMIILGSGKLVIPSIYLTLQQKLISS